MPETTLLDVYAKVQVYVLIFNLMFGSDLFFDRYDNKCWVLFFPRRQFAPMVFEWNNANTPLKSFLLSNCVAFLRYNNDAAKILVGNKVDKPDRVRWLRVPRCAAESTLNSKRHSDTRKHITRSKCKPVESTMQKKIL